MSQPGARYLADIERAGHLRGQLDQVDAEPVAFGVGVARNQPALLQGFQGLDTMLLCSCISRLSSLTPRSGLSRLNDLSMRIARSTDCNVEARRSVMLGLTS